MLRNISRFALSPLLLPCLALVLTTSGYCQQRTIRGNGTFIANGTGSLDVSGTGLVVLSQFTGQFSVKGTEDISGRGYSLLSQQGGWTTYEASNAYVTVESGANSATVRLTGTGSATGDGVGWVVVAGDGWVVKWGDTRSRE